MKLAIALDKRPIAMSRENIKVHLKILLAVALLILSSYFAYSLPSGPTVTVLGNTTATIGAGTKVNSTINSSSPGGYIFTTNLNSRQQDTRWKAYVGNVTGTLALDDAVGNTIFQWSISTVSGEVYATRASTTINWTGINCTWAGEGVSNYTQSNRTVEERENSILSHSNKEDNITATFTMVNHSQVVVGSKVIAKNSCFAVQTWQNDNAQVFSDSDNANFTEVILWDGTNTTNGNVVYTTKIQNDITGYRADSTYDFQIILPENGGAGFSGSTAYYFFVELS